MVSEAAWQALPLQWGAQRFQNCIDGSDRTQLYESFSETEANATCFSLLGQHRCRISAPNTNSFYQIGHCVTFALQNKMFVIYNVYKQDKLEYNPYASLPAMSGAHHRTLT